jgi:outer membrane protein TolC
MRGAAFAFVILLVAWPLAGGRLPVSDPILDALLRDAVSNNFDLRAAAARVREARSLRGITAARGKPQVAGAAGAFELERSIAVPGFGDRRQELYDVGFDASWELDFFGGIRRDRDAALAQCRRLTKNAATSKSP